MGQTERPTTIKLIIAFFGVLIASGCWTIFFTMGLFVGAPTVLIPQMRREANSTAVVSDEMASWIPSTSFYAAIPWVFIIPNLARIYGRKKTSIILSLMTILSFIIFYFSTTAVHILISEICMGFTLASIATLTIIVISEYTSPKYRGIFLTLKTASLFWGIWVSNTIGTFSSWKNIPLFGIICSLTTLTIVFWPESPYWLASKGKFIECKKAHYWLKGTSNESKIELEKLIKSQTNNPQKQLSLKSFLKREFYVPLFLSLVAICQYHFSGKFVFSIYAIEMIKKIMDSERKVYQSMLILDGITVFSSYVGCVLTRILKRRTLLLTSSSLAITFLFIMSLYLYLIKLCLINENQYLSLCFLGAFSFSISIGPLILATSLYGELIPLRFKSASVIIIGISFLVLHGTLLKVAPKLFRCFGLSGTFLFYAILSTIFAVIMYFYLPETKDKSLSEIEEYFKDKKSVDEDVKLVDRVNQKVGTE